MAVSYFTTRPISISGTDYAPGDVVDVSGWSPSYLSTAVRLGWVSGVSLAAMNQVTSGGGFTGDTGGVDLTDITTRLDALEADGGSVDLTPITDRLDALEAAPSGGGGAAIILSDGLPVDPPDDGQTYFDTGTKQLGIAYESVWYMADTTPVAAATALDLPSLWANYDVSVMVNANGTDVATLLDASSNARNAPAVIAAPMDTTGINGLPSLTMNGNEYTIPATKTIPLTAFVVMTNTDTSVGSMPLTLLGNDQNYFYVTPTGVELADTTNAKINVAAPGNDTTLGPHIVYFRLDGTDQMAGIDGVQTTVARSSAISINRIGRYSSYAAYAVKGFIGQIVLYDAALTNSEVDAILAFLSSKWGVTLA